MMDRICIVGGLPPSLLVDHEVGPDPETETGHPGPTIWTRVWRSPCNAFPAGHREPRLGRDVDDPGIEEPVPLEDRSRRVDQDPAPPLPAGAARFTHRSDRRRRT
jgi:hypothetical protein